MYTVHYGAIDGHDGGEFDEQFTTVEAAREYVRRECYEEATQEEREDWAGFIFETHDSDGNTMESLHIEKFGYVAQQEILDKSELLKSDWLTPAEIAAATGTAESTWRNRAARGEIAGAVKKGKQWLIPRGSVK